MSYSRSDPLEAWLDERASSIESLAAGHAHIGGLANRRGRPLDGSKPLAHAFVLVVMREFQGFIRDLHDLTARVFVEFSGVDAQYRSLVLQGLVTARGIDRGNATSATIRSDFSRLGVMPFDISSHNPRWLRPGTDQGTFDTMIALRNALAHGNDQQLDQILTTRRAQDTVTWTRGRLPVLNRYARSLDKVVWDYFRATFGKDPWS